MKIKFSLISLFYCLLLRGGMQQHINDTSLKARPKPEYIVERLNGVNTAASEFCAVPYGNDLLFVASQPKDLVNNSSPVDLNKIPYTDVFQAAILNNNVKNVKPFSAKINGLYHDGPVAFNNDQTILYLTRVEYKNKTSDFVNKAKLYVYEKKANTWWETSAFMYNSDAYSTGHAALSKDGNLLFFSSDMPGGYGGKDIYVCHKTKNGWGKPENIGAGINTSADEEYPYIRDDGTLFFSSKGHHAIGGFDIFSSYFFKGQWLLKKNEEQPLNSTGDDFGIVFANAISGYFSSNREGSDDIFKFTFNSQAITVSGKLLLTENLKEPAKNTLVYLLNSRGEPIDSLHTNNQGVFEFMNLYGDKSFMLSVQPADAEMKEKARFYLANDDEEIVRVSQGVNNDRFVFKNLPLEKSVLQEIYSDEDLSLSGVLTYSNNPALFIANARINLINSYGDVVESATTNEFGSFVFKNLPADQSYLVEIPEEHIQLPYGTIVTLSDKNGKKLKLFITGKDAFKFKLLPPEKYTLSELEVDENVTLDHNGCFQNQNKLKPVANKKIYLLDSKNNLLDSCLTNKYGFFKFKNVVPEKHYIAYFETNDQTLTRRSGYYLKGRDGKFIRTAYLSEGKKHIFRKVPVDSASLQTMELSEKLTLAGKLRYGEKGDIPVENMRVRLLDENGKTIDSLSVNQSGCFIFRNLDPEKTYLLDMDEQSLNLPSNTRVIMAACDGKIIKTFYVGKDKFEYKILPVEKNIMPDLITADQDLAIKLSGYIFSENKRPLKNIQLTLRDSTGKEKEIIKTGEEGKFTFRSLKEDLAGFIEFVTDTSDAVMYIADSKKRIYKRVVLHNGRFEYKLLEVDKAWMGEYHVDDPWLEVSRMEKPDETVTIIENIYYGTNDHKFDSTGQKRLDKAIYALKTNTRLALEIGSHTDSRANDAYNLELSKKRANYAVDYIVSKGISRSRIVGIGYGEKKLLNTCNNSTPCSEEEHAKNRRTEFKLRYAGISTEK